MLRFLYVENTGAAFGLFAGRQGLLAVLTGVILLALLVFLIVGRKKIPAFPKALLWLMLGGALGNLFDRVVYGYVIDFIEVLFVSFPVFNVADMCVTVAFVLLAGWILFSRESKERA